MGGVWVVGQPQGFTCSCRCCCSTRNDCRTKDHERRRFADLNTELIQAEIGNAEWGGGGFEGGSRTKTKTKIESVKHKQKRQVKTQMKTHSKEKY